MNLTGEPGDFKLDRIDFFPTIHGSYELPTRLQLMASYARRIRRPRDWDLQPFLTWSDAYNVERGNPALRPEFINAYDVAVQKRFGQNLVSFEAYYRETYNKIEHVRSVYKPNVILHSTENVGTDYTYGAELMFELDLLRWFSMSLTGNLYDYRVEGTLYGEPFSQGSNNWSIRANNTFRVAPSTRLQISGIYNSPTVTAQGRREGFAITNAALRVRDIFGTARFESTSEGPGFYSHSEGYRKSPVVMLALNYNFNNYKPKREREEEPDEFEGGEEQP
jgi:outer membrane receptor protein involved in Fe transport